MQFDTIEQYNISNRIALALRQVISYHVEVNREVHTTFLDLDQD
jgi:hypothetical protein